MSLLGSAKVTVEPFVSAEEPDYDIGYFSIGYEERSRFVAQRMCSKTSHLVAFKYDTQALDSRNNFSWAKEAGASIVDLAKDKGFSEYRSDENGAFRNHLEQLTCKVVTKSKELRVFFDISSADRSLTARVLINCIRQLPKPVRIDLLYAPAKFVEPLYEFVPLRECAPAIPELAGPIGLHDGPTNLILGVGFEFGVSLDLIQRFEPDETIVFFPTGGDERFETAVRKSNFDFDYGADYVRVVPYNVYQPLATFQSLYSIASTMGLGDSLLIAPNGPKIFGAMGVVAGLLTGNKATVLRSSQYSTPPQNRVEADGKIVGMTLRCS